jgi:hypothetical protein
VCESINHHMCRLPLFHKENPQAGDARNRPDNDPVAAVLKEDPSAAEPESYSSSSMCIAASSAEEA